MNCLNDHLCELLIIYPVHILINTVFFKMSTSKTGI